MYSVDNLVHINRDKLIIKQNQYISRDAGEIPAIVPLQYYYYSQQHFFPYRRRRRQ